MSKTVSKTGNIAHKVDLKRVHKSYNLYTKISETFQVYTKIISMTTNMSGMIAKPEMTMIRSDKSLEASSPFTSVPHVVMTKKITKNKTEISSVLPILPCELGQTAPMIQLIQSICGRLLLCLFLYKMMIQMFLSVIISLPNLVLQSRAHKTLGNMAHHYFILYVHQFP